MSVNTEAREDVVSYMRRVAERLEIAGHRAFAARVRRQASDRETRRSGLHGNAGHGRSTVAQNPPRISGRLLREAGVEVE